MAQRHGDGLLARTLPVLHAVQLPLVALGTLFEHARRGMMRLLHLKDETGATREIVAGLREVIADAEVSGNLHQTEREIIGNVMEFRDEDVAALMTPRTEIQAADVEDGVLAAARIMAASGHSRIPVYEETLDTIIGTISARDLVQLMATGRAESASLRQIVHPAYFVPETKHLSELLGEMRREKMKMAIVLDEYGGTAGLVTMGDLLGELVGEIPDEYDADEPSPLRRMADGAVEVDASLHVSEVNEALDLDLPEESDFETLGGFVLAELGRFPHRGERFRRNGHEFVVVEANDRRVLKVCVRPLASAGAG
jgi:CBS domain containing-hemolysin-like protein